ncbi:unnamed protein product [Pleuronectes platessa]|uniref:Uncharacterized protein n=1 Tax=Pleuronectes platessa TaxID=8262 RepID=A0A9N7UBK8_PLEPL|nr:unnamed protein product [Pleuronectes platessa]
MDQNPQELSHTLLWCGNSSGSCRRSWGGGGLSTSSTAPPQDPAGGPGDSGGALDVLPSSSSGSCWRSWGGGGLWTSSPAPPQAPGGGAGEVVASGRPPQPLATTASDQTLKGWMVLSDAQQG